MCFSKPAAAPPPPPVPPPPPAPVVKPIEPTRIKESERTAKKMAKKRGQAATNVTGGNSSANNTQLASDLPVTKKTLLGS